MSATANKHRAYIEFEVGDFVWLKLQPYRQHSVAKPISAKLAKHFYGPFEILQRIGPVAYKLRLPEGSRIHKVFHVSLLRAFVKGDEVEPLPPKFRGSRPIVHPVAILDSQIMWHNEAAMEHVLIRWSDGSESPSWEPLDVIRRRFPTLPLEDKVVSKEGGVVTSTTLPSSSSTTEATPTSETVDESAGRGETEEASDPASTPTPEEEPGKEEAMKKTTGESMASKLRPRKELKAPDRYQDFVAK